MKKYVLLFLSLSLLGTQVNAQVAFATAKELSMISRGVAKSVRKGNPLYIPGKARVGNTGLYSFQVTRILRRRVMRSRVKAHQTRFMYTPKKDAHTISPAVRMVNLNPTVRPLTESVPYLQTPKQTRLYLVARENRLYAQQTERFYQEHFPQLRENLPLLREGIRTRMPRHPAAFAASVIPAQVNTIALGEVHGFENIRTFVSQFLPQVRKQNPNREIFLFTEFALNAQEYSANSISLALDSERAAIWQAATDNHMRIIGLEPKEVLQDYSFLNVQLGKEAFFLVSTPHGIRKIPFFASATGIKWRNEAFLKTLGEYRKRHPDALFIIYAGDAHVNTRFPFAITSVLNPEETFVISLRPTYAQAVQKYAKFSAKEIRAVWDPLGNEFNGSETFDYPLLYWKDPQLARIAGANMYLRAEESLIAAPPRTW